MILFVDIVWPSLLLEFPLVVWHITAGLLIEGLIVWFIYRASLRDTAIMTVTVNALSTIVGILMIPLFGIGWEIFPGMLIEKLFDVGTFNLGTWTASALFATSANTAIETSALKGIFKRPITGRVICLMFLANAASVGIAMYTVYSSSGPNGGPGLFR